MGQVEAEDAEDHVSDEGMIWTPFQRTGQIQNRDLRKPKEAFVEQWDQ